MSLEAWRTRPLVPASVILHAAAVGATAWYPAAWPWALGAIAADHAVLTATGLWPRSRGLGPNVTRLPHDATIGRVAITIDDGPDRDVTPRVLEMLAAAGARATFFCIGERVTANPELARDIVARGHSIQNHSQSHRHHFSLLGRRGMRREIESAQRSIGAVTGEPPRFFRAPAGLRNPLLQPVLAALELQLVSWTRRGFDTVTRDAGAVYARLATRLAREDILLLHDGNSARGEDGMPVILEVLPRLLDCVARAGLATVTLPEALP
ncbi:MAG: polysaccharide deacetylase family protein [Steroidobacteraceae bacterium]